MQSLDWTTVRQLDWTPIYAKPGSIIRRYRAYGYGALIVRAAEDTLSQARASSNLNQLNAVSAFKSGQSELSTGPTFYPN